MPQTLNEFQEQYVQMVLCFALLVTYRLLSTKAHWREIICLHSNIPTALQKSAAVANSHQERLWSGLKQSLSVCHSEWPQRSLLPQDVHRLPAASDLHAGPIPRLQRQEQQVFEERLLSLRH